MNINSKGIIIDTENDTEYNTEYDTENDTENEIYLRIMCKNNIDFEFSNISKVKYTIDITGYNINTLNIKYKKCGIEGCEKYTYNINNLNDFLTNFTKVNEIDGNSPIYLTGIIIETKEGIIDDVYTNDSVVLNRFRNCIKILRKEKNWDNFLKNIVKIGIELKPRRRLIRHGRHGRHGKHGRHGRHERHERHI